MKLCLAVEQDLNDIEALYHSCIHHLLDNEIYQWNDVYPNSETYKSGVDSRSSYLFKDQEDLIGAVILNELQDKAWVQMPWSIEDFFMAIHAFVIHPLVQGMGYGSKFLLMCEDFARENGYKAIRLDAFSENTAALKLYEKHGYKKIGSVSFSYKPEGHQIYHCYEKKL